ncbi:hypothetical protein DUI87_20376 [Hirundo rustica rustica]|uniref:Reverse transcriptase domain-containing protein n=1 Tax=Hirundo rustica rustica TaxID=333673 RepID=A0A3M0JQ86_HIRRU|nr:hypothetical protein DUI87_20376 [Hirundo rustica rustica]
MAEFGSDLWRTVWFKPMLKQDHLELTAEDHVQMASEYLEGGKLYNLPGQCVLVLTSILTLASSKPCGAEFQLCVVGRGPYLNMGPITKATVAIIWLALWVDKSDGEWRLTVDYRALNEVTPPLSAAVLDMLELQYELESKAAKCPTICHGLIQTALEKDEALEHVKYIDGIIVWGNTAMEVFEKGEKIIQILLEAGFAIKKSKAKGPAREIQFLGVK